MTSPLRLALSASAVFATALLVTGCASSPGAPTSTSAPEQSQGADASHTENDMEATWLDDGRMFAIVTWGSSSCIPTAESVTADGQTVTVELNAGDKNQACTSDIAPRASLGALPEGVDPTKDVELVVTLGDVTDDVDLDGNAALTMGAADMKPSAGWFEDDSLVLLTWGSSTCLPIVDSVEASSGGGTVTFVTEDRMCTMDMAPRATVISFAELDDDADDNDADDNTGDDVDDDAFTLTLVGDNLDATVPVLQG